MFNLTVDTAHTFYVGQNGWLVHNGCDPTRLYHYTSEKGLDGIVQSGQLRPSLKAVNPKDVRYGDGQYLTDIAPGSMTREQLARAFFGRPFPTSRVSHYLEIDVTGLPLVKGRNGVYVVPNSGNLDISARICSTGCILPTKK